MSVYVGIQPSVPGIGGRRSFYAYYEQAGKRIYRKLFRTASKVTAADKKRAKAAAAQLARELDDDAREAKKNHVRPCAIGEAARLYVVAKRGHASASTLDRHERTLDALESFLAGEPAHVHALNVGHIAAFRDSLVAAGTSSATANLYLHGLSAWLKWCIGEGYRSDNPAAVVNYLPVASTRTDAPLQLPADLWLLLDGAESDLARSTVGLLATTGLRIRELGGLQWSQVDFDGMRIVLPPGERETTKRHARVLPIADVQREFLMALKMMQTGPYVCGQDGGARPYTNQPYRWCGRYRPHDMRRFFRSCLEAVGAPAYLIDDLMGHRATRVRRAYIPDISQDSAIWPLAVEVMAKASRMILE